MDSLFDDFEIHVNVDPPVMNYQDKEVFVEDENGVTVYPDQGYDALSSVEVNLVMQSKVINVVENGVQSVVPDEGFCGIDGVTVNVNVPTVSSNHWYLKNLTVYHDYTNASTVLPMDPSYVTAASTIVLPVYKGVVNFIVVGKYRAGYSDYKHLERLSYVIIRHAYGTSSYALYISDILGYTPNFVYKYPMNFGSRYPSYTPGEACDMLNSVRFNFYEYDSNGTETGVFNVVRHNKAIYLGSDSTKIQSGDLLAASIEGINL